MSKGAFDTSATVYCDMTESGMTMTDPKTEFWYGLDAIHCITENGQWEMRVDYQFYNKTWSYYLFSAGKASEKYPLSIDGSTDSFATIPLNGMKFSTLDQGNDPLNYVDNWKAGWWYNKRSSASTYI